MKKIIIGILILGFMVNVYSLNLINATINKIGSSADLGGGTWLVINNDGTNSGATPCGMTHLNPGGGWFFVPKTSDRTKEILSIALTAKTTGTKISIYGSGTCIGGYETVDNIYIN